MYAAALAIASLAAGCGSAPPASGGAVEALVGSGTTFAGDRIFCAAGIPDPVDHAAWVAHPWSLWNGRHGVVVSVESYNGEIGYFGVDRDLVQTDWYMIGSKADAAALLRMDGSCHPDPKLLLPGQGDIVSPTELPKSQPSSNGEGFVPLCSQVWSASQARQQCVYDTACSERGASCGSVPDGFGGQYQCGDCGFLQYCAADNKSCVPYGLEL
jgi:hypothetical protein